MLIIGSPLGSLYNVSSDPTVLVRTTRSWRLSVARQERSKFMDITRTGPHARMDATSQRRSVARLLSFGCAVLERNRLRNQLIPLAIYAIASVNILSLWVMRDGFVGGWELFGATFGVLALNEGSFPAGVYKIAQAVLTQRHRPVFTGGESFIYGLIPGILNNLMPWLLWSQFLSLLLFVVISFWITRKLKCAPHVYWACVLASPALTSYSIVGYPYLASTTIPYALAIAYVLSERQKQRDPWWGSFLDIVTFAAIAAVAFNGYESGKTFFIVPVVAALTISGISIVRRLSWLGCAGAVTWLVLAQWPMNTEASLKAIPLDVSFLMGVMGFARSYLIDWYIDFPALGLAAFISLFLLHQHRGFWTGLFISIIGVLSLNAFHLNGAFLIPHRFLLLGFISALIVSVVLTQQSPRAVPVISAILLMGIAYTSYQTVRFVLAERSDHRRYYNLNRVYPLPYHRAKLDWHIWRDKIRDAKTFTDRSKEGSEPHIFFYGFSIGGEDSVNPQLFVSRILLPLGYHAFTKRITFFDHFNHMYYTFPIKHLAEVSKVINALPTPFFVHIHEPEFSAASLLTKYFNRSQISGSHLGLVLFRSYRVDSFEPAGPIPVKGLGEQAAKIPSRELANYTKGFCLTTWQKAVSDFISRRHPEALSQHFDFLLNEPGRRNVSRRLVAVADEQFDELSFGYFLAYFDNEEKRPILAKLRLHATDEVAVMINEQSIIESLGSKAAIDYYEDVLLPPGLNEIKILYHKFWNSGGMTFSTIDESGKAIPWTCNADFR